MRNEVLELDPVKEEIKEYWDRTKEHAFFKDEEEEDAWRQSLRKEFGGEKLRILDVGTGNGSLAILLAQTGHNVVGIDISEGMLSVARKKAKERGVMPDFRIGDAESPDFDDNSFDAVVSRWVLWTLPDPEKAVRAWRRVLKPGGKVYAFESDSGPKGIERWIRRNLGLFLIAIIEGKNPWKRGSYSKNVKEGLPLGYEKPSSNVINKLELFRRGGFLDVSAFRMDEVSEVSRKKRDEAPLRYKLAWGGSSERLWYYIKGIKPTSRSR